VNRFYRIGDITVRVEDVGCEPWEFTQKWRDAAQWDPQAATRLLRELAEDIPPQYRVQVSADIEEI
jgi:hypothetical protein